MAELKSRFVATLIDLSHSLPPRVRFLLTVPRRCFSCGLFVYVIVCLCIFFYGEIFILDSRLAHFCIGKELSFWLSAYSVLIVVPLL